VVLFRRALVVVLLASCAPPQSVDRAVVESDARPDRAVPTGDAPVEGGEEDADPDASAPDAVAPDAPTPDAGADTAEPTDAALPDTTVDQGPARTALLVVGSRAVPTVGDQRLQQILAGRGLTVKLASDEDTANVVGVDLVMLAESSASPVLADKYRDVPVPVVVLERAVFFSMGMTGNNTLDQGTEPMSTQVSIVMQSHALAAGLSGTVAVLSAPATIGWGNPPAGAQRVATVPGATSRVVIFGYPRGAMMVVGQAPARRVGSFVMDGAASVLNDNGVTLLGAAIDWALQ
jgi:hypothetical protein